MLTRDEQALHTNGPRPRWWFVAYQTKRDGGKWEPANMVTNEHPLDWLADALVGWTDSVQITFYKETSRARYERLLPRIG
jgi:hypothetical protein